jgi:hypothetical protein
MVPSKQKIISSKFPDEEILSQVTLEPEGHKEIWFRGKNGAMEITTGKPNTISKINESKVD